jgi:hypothetical protein
MVILWHTPLRSLLVDEEAAPPNITLHAGHDEPYMEITIEAVTELRLSFDSEKNLEGLHLVSDDGAISVLLFSHEARL